MGYGINCRHKSYCGGNKCNTFRFSIKYNNLLGEDRKYFCSLYSNNQWPYKNYNCHSAICSAFRHNRARYL